MVSDAWLQAFGGLSQSYGLTASAFSTLFVLILSIGLSLAISVYVKKHYEVGFDFGLVMFYLFMALFTLGGAMDWFVFGIMGVLGIIIYKAVGKDGN